MGKYKYSARELFVLDEFARAAMTALILASPEDRGQWPEMCDEIAADSYTMAIAMVKHRDRLKLRPTIEQTSREGN